MRPKRTAVRVFAALYRTARNVFVLRAPNAIYLPHEVGSGCYKEVAVRYSIVCFVLAVQVCFSVTHAATLPCPSPTYAPCNAAKSNTDLRVAHSDFRSGMAKGSFVVGGEYGEGVRDEIERERLFEVTQYVRSTEYVSTIAEAGTLDGSMRASAVSEIDLARGTIRGRIDGYDSTVFPASILEISQLRLDLGLTERILLHLPANFEGGTLRADMAIDGTIVDVRPSSLGGIGQGWSSTQVYAHLQMGEFDFRRWYDEGDIFDILSVELEIPKTASYSIDLPVNLNAFIRLDSGDGNGSFAIDFGNTATISLKVPDGISWESQSGVFLTAVPLPSAVWLFAGSLAMLGYLGRGTRAS